MKIAFVDKRHLMWLNKQRTEPPLSQMIKLVIYYMYYKFMMILRGCTYQKRMTPM